MPNTAKKRPSAKRLSVKRSAAKNKTTPKKAVPKRPSKAPTKKASPKRPAIDSKLLAEQIDLLRPALRAHGGDIELVRIETSRVIVRLTGACAGCPMAQVTLKQGVENFLVKRVPGVAAVEAAPPEDPNDPEDAE